MINNDDDFEYLDGNESNDINNSYQSVNQNNNQDDYNMYDAYKDNDVVNDKSTVSQNDYDIFKNNINEMGDQYNIYQDSTVVNDQLNGNVYGVYQDNFDNSQQTSFNNYSSVNTSNDDYLNVYIGKKYDKIIKKGFSFPAFFFGGLYFIYRKMYLTGIIIYAIQVLLLSAVQIINAIFPGIIIPILYFVIILLIDIYLGLNAKKMYINYADKEISKIRNNNVNNNDITNQCIKRGGTSLVWVILIVIIVGITSGFITSFVVNAISFSNSISDIISSNTNNNDKENNNVDNSIDNDKENDDDQFNGIIINNTKVVIKDKFNMILPDNYVESFMNSDYAFRYEYSTSDSSMFNNCEIDLSAVNGYKDAKSLANAMTNFYDVEDSSFIIKINNITWYSFQNDNTYYYVSDNDGIVYLYKYIIESRVTSEKNKCLYDKETFVSSLEFK